MDMEKATEIVLAQELFERGLSKSAIARPLVGIAKPSFCGFRRIATARA